MTKTEKLLLLTRFCEYSPATNAEALARDAKAPAAARHAWQKAKAEKAAFLAEHGTGDAAAIRWFDHVIRDTADAMRNAQAVHALRLRAIALQEQHGRRHDRNFYPVTL